MGDHRLGETILIATSGLVIIGATFFWYPITGWEESLLIRDGSAPKLRSRPTRGWGKTQGLSSLSCKLSTGLTGGDRTKNPQNGFRVRYYCSIKAFNPTHLASVSTVQRGGERRGCCSILYLRGTPYPVGTGLGRHAQSSGVLVQGLCTWRHRRAGTALSWHWILHVSPGLDNTPPPPPLLYSTDTR